MPPPARRGRGGFTLLALSRYLLLPGLLGLAALAAPASADHVCYYEPTFALTAVGAGIMLVDYECEGAWSVSEGWQARVTAMDAYVTADVRRASYEGTYESAQPNGGSGTWTAEERRVILRASTPFVGAGAFAGTFEDAFVGGPLHGECSWGFIVGAGYGFGPDPVVPGRGYGSPFGCEGPHRVDELLLP